MGRLGTPESSGLWRGKKELARGRCRPPERSARAQTIGGWRDRGRRSLVAARDRLDRRAAHGLLLHDSASPLAPRAPIHELRARLAALPPCRLAALPPCRLAALPPCRLAALPPCRPRTPAPGSG